MVGAGGPNSTFQSSRQKERPPKRARRSRSTRGVNRQLQASFSTSALIESTGSKKVSIGRRTFSG